MATLSMSMWMFQSCSMLSFDARYMGPDAINPVEIPCWRGQVATWFLASRCLRIAEKKRLAQCFDMHDVCLDREFDPVNHAHLHQTSLKWSILCIPLEKTQELHQGFKTNSQNRKNQPLKNSKIQWERHGCAWISNKKKNRRARKEIEEIRHLLRAFAFGRHDPTRWLRSRSLRRVPMCPMECIFVPDGCFLETQAQVICRAWYPSSSAHIISGKRLGRASQKRSSRSCKKWATRDKWDKCKYSYHTHYNHKSQVHATASRAKYFILKESKRKICLV